MGHVRQQLTSYFRDRPRYRVRRRAYLFVISLLEPLVEYALAASRRDQLRLRRLLLDLFHVGVGIALRLFPKGRRDCRAHEWHATLDPEIERCKICEAGVRAVAPESTDPWRSGVKLAEELMVREAAFAALVDRIIYAAGQPDPDGTGGEALLLASWFRWIELEDEE